MKKIFEEVEGTSREELMAALKKRAPEAFNSKGELLAKSTKLKLDDKIIDIPFELLLEKKIKERQNKDIGVAGKVPIRREQSANMFKMLMDSMNFDNTVEYEVREKKGWKPSYEHPIPRIRCTAFSKSMNEQCRITAFRGSTVCARHGAKQMDNRKEQRAAIEAARARLVTMTGQAIDVVQDILADPETNQNTRLKAAQDVMDRAGLKPGVDITMEVNHNHNIATEMREKMMAMRTEQPVIEAEIVSED